VLFAFATSIPQLVVYWFLMQVATNFILTPIGVHIPERVPVPRRGLFSAAQGVAQTAGGVIGQSFGALFAALIPLGYVVVGVLLFLGVAVFAIVNRRSNIGVPRPAVDVLSILKGFWINPVKHPNFAWAFFGRFLLMVGYFPLNAYTLYILQSYVGLGDKGVELVPAVGLANLIGTFVGTPIAGLLADRLRRSKPMILAASIVLVVAFAIPMISPTIPAMLVYGFLSGMGLGAYFSVDYVLITQVLPSMDDAGKDLGIINITTTLPQTIGVAVGGTIVTIFAGYFALFPVAIVFVILGAVLLFLIRGVR
jgi:MFS family permease